MKAQSVLYNYIILLNRENERTHIQISFLKLNPPPLQPILAIPPHMNPPFKRKTPTPLKKVFEN